MKANTQAVLSMVGLSEGGYVNDPHDPGGPTNHGITQRTYTAWLETRGEPSKDVKLITMPEVIAILSEQYLAPVWFDRLPSGVDYAVADFSVNSGAAQAIKTLQRTLGDLKVDGIMGVHTLAAVQAALSEKLIVDYCNARLAFMRSLKIWGRYKVGWTRRVMGEQLGSQATDIGVIDRATMMARKSLPSQPVVKANPHKADTAAGLKLIPALLQLIEQLILALQGRKLA